MSTLRNLKKRFPKKSSALSRLKEKYLKDQETRARSVFKLEEDLLRIQEDELLFGDDDDDFFGLDSMAKDLADMRTDLAETASDIANSLVNYHIERAENGTIKTIKRRKRKRRKAPAEPSPPPPTTIPELSGLDYRGGAVEAYAQLEKKYKELQAENDTLRKARETWWTRFVRRCKELFT